MKFENHTNHNCQITLNDGDQYLIYANWMHNNDQDHWQGWDCQAGAVRLHIDKNLEVWSGECKNDHLGSALDENFAILDGTVCRRDRCTGCTDDLIVAKKERKS